MIFSDQAKLSIVKFFRKKSGELMKFFQTRMATGFICIFMGLSLFAFASNAFAVDPSNPRLAAIMKQIGETFKAIQEKSNDPASDAANAANTLKLEQLTIAAKIEVPIKVQSLPADQRSARTIDYKKLLNELLVIETRLEDDFLDGDRAGVKTDIDAIKNHMMTGHLNFK